ncbi:hypothetical protein BHM03_00040976 [Ensete ventricosum]|nr:hypothetical protein BHM03_00040976 [Ensete ventricosum]
MCLTYYLFEKRRTLTLFNLQGTGKKKLERQLAQLEDMFPNKVSAHMKFNAPLAHEIMAGADLLALTSRFEPCGLIQLQGMRYGICDVVDKDDVQKVIQTVKRALQVYGTPAFAEMIQNCMTQDLSWKGPAKKWEQFLLSLGAAGGEAGIDAEEIAPLAKENVATP